MTRTPARRAAAPWSDLAVLGIDPSLTATGVALVVGGVLQKADVITSDSTAPQPVRLRAIRSGVASFLHSYRPTLVAMEAVAFGMPMQASILGAVQGILQVVIWECIENGGAGHFLPVNIAHVKKWVGAKQKNEILLQVYKQYGLTFADHNAADATVIAMIADSYLAYHSGHVWPWTKPQHEVLDKLTKTGYPWEAPPAPKVRKPKKEGGAA